MGKMYQCDRCGKLDKPKFTVYSLPHDLPEEWAEVSVLLDDDVTRNYMICEKCLQDYMEWWDTKPEDLYNYNVITKEGKE
jgi:hypothetical protein